MLVNGTVYRPNANVKNVSHVLVKVGRIRASSKKNVNIAAVEKIHRIFKSSEV